MKVQQSGLFVSKERPYLAGSPDGLVDKDHTIEVKCPYSFRHEKISTRIPFLQLNDEGNLELKKTSNYYDQVQGQLYVAGRKSCYFVIYTFVDLVALHIAIDHDYISTCLLPKLELFYHRTYLPFISKSL